MSLSKVKFSISTKIQALVLCLVAAGFLAEYAVSKYSASEVKKETDQMVIQIEEIIADKDKLIDTLLDKSLNDGESRLSAEQDKENLIAQRDFSIEKSHLSGVRDGMSEVILTLINSAMMGGEAEQADTMIETVLENDEIAAVNLWRTNGQRAFRDNATIDQINTFMDDPEAFARRDNEEVEMIAEERAATLKDIVTKHKDGQPTHDITLNSEIEGDEDKPLPVVYSYFVLENAEDCQGCHEATGEPRGVLEIAVSREKLIKQEKKVAETQKKLAEEQKKQVAELLVLAQQARNDKVKTSKEIEAKLHGAQDELAETQDSASTSFIVASIAFFVILSGIMTVTFRFTLTNPITKMTENMHELATGNLKVKILEGERNDEIGEMADALRIFRKNAEEVETLREEQEAAQRHAEEKQRAVLHKMADDFEANVSGVVEAVDNAAQNMQTTAQGMSATASATSDQSSVVASAAEQATNNVQTVASASEELSASIGEISRQVETSTAIAQNAVQEASQASETVQGLSSAADKVGEVVQLITSIAEQTNLLALNATIEASRAGEAGKGFAVVASEVKNLADQTSRATAEIAEQIEAMQSATGNAVQAIQGITHTIDSMNDISSSISIAVEEQGAATTEISKNVQEAANGTLEVTNTIESVSIAAAETGNASNMVLSASDDLGTQASALKDVVSQFLKQVRNG
ncbi:methyl-accepting chemotaxis protein [Terasakiella sp. A23]|uniref:methyl-accepting chemotaxis protein n=1 Tax=Terasakiella sp. FCG-A23 TaxID=3080561 RepID=UPI002954EA20|nr:methyl-accepting chemotaxis protein [Terasakiella sp. A23]MDV7339105.1 methyl-accepting chemotaxis protein [Terasakiella sp. A23]